MDFSRYDDDEEIQTFLKDVRTFLAEELTSDRLHGLVNRRDDFDPDFQRALGSRGWVLPQWPRERGGAGLDPLQARALDLELIRVGAPRINLSTTRTILPAVIKFGDRDVARKVSGTVARGEACIAMGYSEPEGGSDIAAARTAARRDGDDWVISGQKVFTTGAHHCRYVFLLTRTDPDAAKHAGLTMFLVPLDTDGIHVSPMHTLDERTNLLTLDSVRVPDNLRVGPTKGGWKVLLDPLNREHGLGSSRGIIDAATRHSRRLADALEAAVGWAATPAPDGSLPGDDPRVRDVIAEATVDLLSSSSTWGHTGRVAAAEAYVGRVGDLCDLVGAETVVTGHPWDSNPVGVIEFHRRSSQVSTLYGGSVEVIRDVIAQEIGLPRWSR